MKRTIYSFLYVLMAVSLIQAATDSKKTDKKSEEICYLVDGMTCMGCVSNVESSLKAVEGVREYDVSLKENQATVKYNPDVTDPAKIEEALKSTGFRITLQKDTENKKDEEKSE